MTPREVLLRLQNNIKARLLQARQFEDALDVIETMLLIAPNATALWRESGLLNARLDNVKAAVAALEEFMRRDSGDTSRYRTSVLLQELRGRLN
jgi:regulator of sirC expression with transglutaminase-like and TPR domain